MSSNASSINSASCSTEKLISCNEIAIMIITKQSFDLVCYEIFRETLKGQELLLRDHLRTESDSNFKMHYLIEGGFQIVVKRPPEPLSDWCLKVYGFFEGEKTYEKGIKVIELFKLNNKGEKQYYYC